ncbi:MAG TPA: winged helix-turn-helix domain-containing protein [Candidatus Dormibacteraeota bacterium]|nr:winged helix-turn-helix domain-containing protein [Candidatus Dormibacteraeota bacterium]
MDRQAKHLLEFGPFRMDLDERVLMRDRETITLSPKAFETLLVLVQHSERVVLKDDLMKTLWPDTFVEESNLSQHIFQLRKALGDKAHDPEYIVTVPGRGYRFARKVAEITEPDGDLIVHSRSVQTLTVEETDSRPSVATITSFAKLRQRPWNWILGSTAAIVLLASAYAVVLRLRRPPPMNEADLVLVSDFVNTTGDPIFDGTLKQALTLKLAESPYFSIAPDSTTRKTLGLMGRSADEHVVPPIAREVCQRENAKVVVGGSILSLGNKYVLDLNTTNCLTGTSVAHQAIEAVDREQVLSKLGQAIPPLRRKLGESVASIQKFDTPIEQATTKSLPALKAYTTAIQKRAQGQHAESIPFFKMAIELDPDFAMAYAGLSSVNDGLSQPDLARQYIQKALERREHATEREKLSIQASYYIGVTRETGKVIEIYKLWTEAYSHDFVPFVNLSRQYQLAGQLENAIKAAQQALRLNPRHAVSYECLGASYRQATHFAEAKTVCEKAVTEKLDDYITHNVLYDVAFVDGDAPGMQREIDWFKGNPAESSGVYHQAKAALSLGELRRARELFERGGAIAQRNGLKEQAIAINNGLAQFEAELKNDREARTRADWTLRESPNSERHKAWAALALARAGDVQRAEALVNELSKQPRLGTALSEVILPSVRAAVDLNRENPAAAVEELQRAIPYDLGGDSAGVTIYYRGLAYLELKSGKQAAAQFQRILDNRGVVIVDIYWPLAHLGLARAYAQTGDTEKSLAQYRELLAFWKNADPDLRLLKEASAEYKKLSQSSLSAP